MKPSIAAIALGLIAATPSFAANSRFERSLRHLDPVTRQVQICDFAAMKHINRDANPFRPDRAVVNAISNPRVKENVLQGSGGAFRSRGQWYRFSFTCSTSPDRMKVLSFQYTLGAPIPENEWAQYGLWR